MKRVLKYPLAPAIGGVLEIPAGEVVAVDFQSSTEAFVWVLVDHDETEIQRLAVYPTGVPIDKIGAAHVGSAVSDWLVWHVFRLP